MRKYLGIFNRYPNTPFATALRNLLASGTRAEPAGRSLRVAVQCMPDGVYVGLMAVLIQDIRQIAPAACDLIVVRSVNAGLGFGLVSEIKRSALAAWIVMSQWRRVFGSLVRRVGYRSSSWAHPLVDTLAVWHSYRDWHVWRSTRMSAQGQAGFPADGVNCGDLVIDSYLRLRPSADFHVHDPLVWRLIWQARRDIYRARRYFRQQKPHFYFTPYSTYIDHGIAVRVALQERVPVYSFGNFVQFGLQLVNEHITHSPDCRHYRQAFEALPASVAESCLQRAQVALEYRLSGGIDHATSYMRQSAYAGGGDLPAYDLAGAVVVFLHDFYDSPHVWENLVFLDFWDWICCTIETLTKQGVSFYIKPHPNQIALSDEAVTRLKNKYDGLRWLDASVSNVTLARAPIACGVTVYGTVAHELAYLGVPSIGAASHPHVSFEFCRTARSREAYVAMLADYSSTSLGRDEMRRQALAFYAMHNNLHHARDEELGAAFMKYWIAAAYATTRAQADASITALQALRASGGYQDFLKNLVLEYQE